MRVLITGDRDWGNAQVWGRAEAERQMRALKQALTALHAVAPDSRIVHGGAAGADSIGGTMASELFGSERIEVYEAQWDKYGKSAGPRRNQQMIDESDKKAVDDGHMLECAIVCHSDLERSKGTLDMVNRLKKFLTPDKMLYLR